MDRIMPERVEFQATPKARFGKDILRRETQDVINQLGVGRIKLQANLRKRQAEFLFRHLRIERIDTTVQV